MNVDDPANPVLIIDDNPQYTALLSKMLSGVFGYTDITTKSSLQDGYETITESPTKFKLVFIDFRFPTGETGADLLRKLASEHLLEDKVAFLITSEPNADNVKAAAQAGAMGVVAKPFDRGELKKQLEKASRAMSARSIDSF